MGDGLGTFEPSDNARMRTIKYYEGDKVDTEKFATLLKQAVMLNE